MRAFLVLLLAALLATGVYLFLTWGKVTRPIANYDGVKQVSSAVDGRLAIYEGERLEGA